MSADIASKLNADSAADAAPLFVINLCASTSPMALTHPNTPELKRYTFFVSRQREDGRERFRLHMGYFASQEEAESLLVAVRDVYPAAWAGPAPTSGMPKRARVTAVPPLVVAAPTPVAEPQPAAPVVVAAAPASSPSPSPAPALAAAPAAASVAKSAPVLEAMSNVRDVLAQLDDQTAPAGKAAARQVDAKTAPAPAPASVPARAPAPQAAAGPAVVAAPVRAPSPVAPAGAIPAVVPVVKPLKEAAAAGASAPPAASAPVATASPAAAATAPAVPAASIIAAAPAAAATTTPAAAPARATARELDASQTLQVLEAPSAATPIVSVTMDDEVAETSDVRIVTPEDTQTLRDIKLDAQNNAPPCFAVQLVWAVTPIDVGSLPHLAIFDAYTLYNVEGSRQGRKWYGLRLGFFSDPHSATQVAHYVRSDYQAVAVVPVALKERDHARGGNKAGAVAPRLGDVSAPQKPQDEVKLQAQGLDGFELLQDDRPRPEKRDVEDIGARPAAAAAAGAAAPKPARERIAAAVNAPRPAAGTPAAAKGKAPVAAPVAPKATGKPTGKRVVVRKRPETPMRTAPGAPQPLESTLEILGASTLTIDESREIVNDSAVRKPIEKKQGSRFAKLLNRLSGG